MPVLAVCRGFQVLNVARGGDLVQHLPDVVGNEQHREVKGVFSDHGVKIEDDSRLGAVLGDRAPVKSRHHQGVGRVGERAARGRVGRRRHDRGARGSGAAVRASACCGIRRPGRTRSSSRRSSPRRAPIERSKRSEHRPQPGDRGAARGARVGGRRGDRRRGRAREGGVPGVARRRADRSRAAAAPARDARRGASRGALAHRVAQRRQADQRRARRGRAWSRRSSTSTPARSTSSTARRFRSPAAST